MTTKSDFLLSIAGIQAPPTPYGSQVSFNRSIEKHLLAGNGTDQMSVLLAKEQVLAASGTLTLDLVTDTDRYGVALGLDDIALIFVENVDDASGGGALELRPNASNGFTNLLGASSAQKLPIGTFYCVGNFTADKLDVTGTNKKLDIVETGGALPALVRVIIFGRR